MLVNLRRDTPPSGGRYAPVRAGVYAQRGALMLRLSIQRLVAEEYGLAEGDRVEIKFGYGADRGEVLLVKSGAPLDKFSYRVSKKAGSRDVSVSVSLLPDWLRAQPTAPCLHRGEATALHITLPQSFIDANAL